MKNYVIIIFLNAFDHGLKGVCGGWTGSRVEGVGEGMFVFLGGGWVVYEAYEGKKKRGKISDGFYLEKGFYFYL